MSKADAMLRLDDAERAVIPVRDRDDALRVIESAVTLIAIPGLISPLALEIATRRLRELASGHPHAAELFGAIITHLENYS